MQTRLLPREEWDERLAPSGLFELAPHLPPRAEILAVEEDGRILGAWSAVPKVHLECIWIDPAYRRRASVARRLLEGMRRVVKAMSPDDPIVVTSAMDDSVRTLIEEFGGTQMPGTHHVLPMGGA